MKNESSLCEWMNELNAKLGTGILYWHPFHEWMRWLINSKHSHSRKACKYLCNKKIHALIAINNCLSYHCKQRIHREINGSNRDYDVRENLKSSTILISVINQKSQRSLRALYIIHSRDQTGTDATCYGTNIKMSKKVCWKQSTKAKLAFE